MNTAGMNCTSLQLESKTIAAREEYAHGNTVEALGRIAHILDAKQIDLGELVEAICAVPGFAQQLCRLLAKSGVEYGTVNDAAVLAGRSGIRTILCECLQSSQTNGRAVLFVLPQSVSSQPKSSPAQIKFRLAEL